MERFRARAFFVAAVANVYWMSSRTLLVLPLAVAVCVAEI